MKIIVPLIIAVAIASVLYQVINWEKVAEEYAPIVEFFEKTVDGAAGFIPAKQPVEAVDDKVTEIPAVPKTVEYTVKHTAMPVDDSPEISNVNYSWLQAKAERNSYPTVKDDLRAALENDGVIRETEYQLILDHSIAHSEKEGAAARSQLKEFLKE